MKTVLNFIAFIFLSAGIYAQIPSGEIAPNWTAEDIFGNEHTLYEYLDQGYTVIIDFSATWCGPCWSYHNSGNLENLYEEYGPEGTDEVMVFFIEGDSQSNLDCLYGNVTDCDHPYGTQGNWVDGTPYPIINNSAIATDYHIAYWPTVYMVCQNRIIEEIQTITTEQIYAKVNNCPQPEYNQDVSITALTPFGGMECNETVQPVVKVQNNGNETITAMEINYTIDELETESYSWTGSLSLYYSEEITLPEIVDLEEKMHTINIEIVSINGLADENQLNNTINTSFYFNPDGSDLRMYFITDSDPEESSWKIEKEGELIVEGGNFSEENQLHTEDFCLDEGNCYEFTVMDENDNGFGSGSVRLMYNGEQILKISGDDFDSELTQTFCIGDTTSTSKDFSVKELQIFPNPAKGFIYLNNPTEGQLFVFDLLGKKAHSEFVSKSTKMVNLSSLKPGIYFVKVYTENYILEQKIVLN